MALTTDAAITRFSSLAIVPDPENPNNGFYAPALTTAQRNAIPANVLSNGGIIYNTTENQLQAYVNDAWGEVAAGGVADFIAPSAAADPGVPVDGQIYYNTVTNEFKARVNGAWRVLFYTTDLTGVLVATVVANAGTLPAAPAEGMMVYQTDINVFKVYSGAAWTVLGTSITATTGIGLVGVNAGTTPLVVPAGTNAAVQVAGNQENGFIYYDNTSNTLRAYVNGVWKVVFSTTDLTGVLIPTVVANAGTLPAAPAEGMMVYQTDINVFKVYSGAAWTVLGTSTTAATGVGLTGVNAGNTPLVYPSGVNATVEVAANQVNGFTYYGTTSNTLRAYVNGVWVTITTGA